MKIKGRKLDSPVIETLVIPRPDGDLVFRAQCVKSYDAFDKLCPKPEAPVIIKPSGEKILDVEDADFSKALNTWAENRITWMLLESLKATPDLEWETVVPNDSATWANFGKELDASNLTTAEVTRIMNLCVEANGLNQSKIDKATKDFLAGELARQGQQ